MSDRWRNNDVISLINAYKRQDILWNTGNHNFKRRDLRKIAWERLAATIRRPVSAVKTKMNSLKTTHRNILRRPEGTGSVNWFAWPYLQFIRDNAAQQNATNSNQSTNPGPAVAARITRTRPSMAPWVPLPMPTPPGPTNPPANETSSVRNETPQNQTSGNASTTSQTADNQPPVRPQPTPSNIDPQSSVRFQTPRRRLSTNEASESRASTRQSSTVQASENQATRNQPTAARETENGTPNQAVPSTPSSENIDQYQSYANYLATVFRRIPRRSFLSMRSKINTLIDEAEMEIA